MAVLELDDGTTRTKLKDIVRELAPLKVRLSHWLVGKDSQVHHLLSQESLNQEEKEWLLTALDHYFEQLKHTADYQFRDLIVLHPETPNLSALLAKFDRCHLHQADEVRYIIDGEGVFGFVRPDGSQIKLTVQSEDYIQVPAGTEHWFHLTPSRRIKAVRYFTTTEGWVPHYTNTEIRSGLATG